MSTSSDSELVMGHHVDWELMVPWAPPAWEGTARWAPATCHVLGICPLTDLMKSRACSGAHGWPHGQVTWGLETMNSGAPSAETKGTGSFLKFPRDSDVQPALKLPGQLAQGLSDLVCQIHAERVLKHTPRAPSRGPSPELLTVGLGGAGIGSSHQSPLMLVLLVWNHESGQCWSHFTGEAG